MTSGGKRGGTGERVLEGRHVIGLFMLMLLFSGVFFTLGYVMGRSQVGGQARASTDFHGKLMNPVSSKQEPASKPGNPNSPNGTRTDKPVAPDSDWEFYHAGDSKKPEERLKPLPPAPPASGSAPVLVKTATPPRTVSGPRKNVPANVEPAGAYILQVAALTKEADAMDLATRLQKKKFPAFVLSPQTDKYYRVQVGPYAASKAAQNAKKDLEGAGFKAIIRH